MNIGFIGLGKVGLPIAEAIGEHFNVKGFDLFPKESKIIHICEDLAEAANTDLVCILIQTPHDPGFGGETPCSHLKPKDFDYSYVDKLLEELEPHLHKNQEVVLMSTVLPGTMRNHFKAHTKNYRLTYCPVIIHLGSVADDFKNQEYWVIGNEDASPSPRLEEVFQQLTPNAKIFNGTWEDGETHKILFNTLSAFKISFANMVQDLSMQMGNMNAAMICEALSHSKKRIYSSMYTKPGMGDGGPCHPRDNIAARKLIDDFDLGYDLFKFNMDSREIQAKRLAKYLIKFEKPIVILGKSYKVGVPYTDGSSSLLVAHYLKELGQKEEHIAFDQNPWDQPACYLLAHPQVYNDYPFIDKSVVIDPWQACPQRDNVQILHYGNSR
jgi:UDPglucose 6-dehydrogenase